MTASPQGPSGADTAPPTAAPRPATGAESGRTPDADASSGIFGRFAALFGQAPAPRPNPAETTVPRQTAGLPGLGNLRRLRVEDVAVPRVEIVAIPSDMERDALYHVFKDSGNTRLPVFDGTLDQPLGLIHLKDFALTYGFNGAADAAFDLRSLVRPLLYAPPSMPLGVLLQKMQTDGSHMALVIDEYGGVDGLVTIEDLLEQVVGEITDEHDEVEDALWSEEKPGCFMALARTPLDEFERVSGVHLSADGEGEEIETLGGLLFMHLGRVPTRGEVIGHPTGVQFEVVDADPRRIKRLRVRMPGTVSGTAKAPDGAAAGATKG